MQNAESIHQREIYKHSMSHFKGTKNNNLSNRKYLNLPFNVEQVKLLIYFTMLLVIFKEFIEVVVTVFDKIGPELSFKYDYQWIFT